MGHKIRLDRALCIVVWPGAWVGEALWRARRRRRAESPLIVGALWRRALEHVYSCTTLVQRYGSLHSYT